MANPFIAYVLYFLFFAAGIALGRITMAIQYAFGKEALKK